MLTHLNQPPVSSPGFSCREVLGIIARGTPHPPPPLPAASTLRRRAPLRGLHRGGAGAVVEQGQLPEEVPGHALLEPKWLHEVALFEVVLREDERGVPKQNKKYEVLQWRGCNKLVPLPFFCSRF